MSRIAIITDTSSDLLPERAKEKGITLVPLTVSFGSESWAAVTELSNEDFFEKLTAPGAPFPKTAAPSPAAFEAAYREALAAGADGVVCVTISQKLSATYSSAVQGAEPFDDGQVEVFDSMTTTHSLAMMATGAAELAAGGATMAEVSAYVRDVRMRSGIYFSVDTLEYLQKGGRIGRASALLGSVLSIKPILFVEDGAVATADKKRTSAKARARLLELATERPLERAVALHTMTPGIEEFADELAAASGLDRDDIEIGLVGPVAGTHVGPRMVGVALIRTA
ncbi:MAG: DegV family protein [Chloroflexota bacterium]